MATKIKHKRIDTNFVKKNYPVLYETIEAILPAVTSKEEPLLQRYHKEFLYGLCIEIALKSDGTVDLFEDDLPEDLLKVNEYDFD